MPSNNPNVHKNLKKFKKGESGNPNGRPRKSFRTVNEAMQAKGIEKLSRSQLLDAYALVLNATEDELKTLELDDSLPFAFRILIKELQGSSTRTAAFKDFRDYSFGRAIQQTDITTKGKSINDLSIDELKAKAQKLLNEQSE